MLEAVIGFAIFIAIIFSFVFGLHTLVFISQKPEVVRSRFAAFAEANGWRNIRRGRFMHASDLTGMWNGLVVRLEYFPRERVLPLYMRLHVGLRNAPKLDLARASDSSFLGRVFGSLQASLQVGELKLSMNFDELSLVQRLIAEPAVVAALHENLLESMDGLRIDRKGLIVTRVLDGKETFAAFGTPFDSRKDFRFDVQVLDGVIAQAWRLASSTVAAIRRSE